MSDVLQLLAGFAVTNGVLCGMMLYVMRSMLKGIKDEVAKDITSLRVAVDSVAQENLYTRLNVEKMKAELAVDYVTRHEHDQIVRDLERIKSLLESAPGRPEMESVIRELEYIKNNMSRAN